MYGNLAGFRKLGIALATALFAATVNARADGVPALDIQAPSGAHSVLIGSMHIGYPLLRQPTPDVLKGARIYVIEHLTAGLSFQPDDISSPSRGEIADWFAGKAVRAAWSTQLSDVEVEILRERVSACNSTIPEAAPYGMTDLVLSMHRSLAAGSLAYNLCTVPTLQSRDKLMQQAADGSGVPTVELETQQEVWRKRAAVPESTYLETLRSGLQHDLRPAYAEMVRALNSGDYQKVQNLMSVGVGDTPVAGAEFKRIMLDERNAAWLPKLRGYFDQGGAVVLVGAGHLGGRNGLMAMLEHVAYKVTRIELAAMP